MKTDTSLTFRSFQKLGIIHNEERFGKLSPWGIFKHACKTLKIACCFKIAYKPGFVETIYFNSFRAWLWRKMGATVGKHVCIGHSVSIDIGNTNLITIEDHVILTNGCTVLCHRRDVSDYHKGDEAHKLHYLYKPVTLKRECQIGMGTIIMPGVTIGEGAIVGARSVVTKDIPAWTVAAGSPCKVIKEIAPR